MFQPSNACGCARPLLSRRRDVLFALPGHRPRRAAGLALLATALALSGCSTGRFTQAAGEFGTQTRTAAQLQNQRLVAVAADEKERFRQGLADAAADLRIADCARTLAAGVPDAQEAAEKPVRRCRVVLRSGPGQFGELPPDTRFDNITALNTALVNYAEGLERLAADATKDKEAFTGSVVRLATSLGGLDGAVRKVAENGKDDAGAATDKARLSAIGTLVAKAGNLYFAARRQAALKEIIIAGDPLVQRATAILGDADSQLDLYDRVPLYAAVIEAQQQADAARSGGDAAAIRKAQDRLFAAVEAFNGYRLDRSRFAAIAAAHARLVEAARSGASAAELQQAIVAVLDLASTIGETRNAFDTENK